MSKHVFLAREYFNEAEVRDLLMNPTINAKSLNNFSRSRKVFYSNTRSRASRVENLSRMFLDWNEFHSIAKLLDKPRKEAKSRPVRFNAKLSPQEIDAVVKELRKDRGSSNGETYEVSQSGDNSIINTTYIDVDPSKARYHQREEINTAIEVHPEEEHTTFYFEDIRRAKQITDALVKEVRLLKDEFMKVDLNKLRFTGVSPNEISDFFINLINSLPSFELDSVTKVKLQSPEIHSGEDVSEDSFDEVDEEPEEEIDVESSDEEDSLESDNDEFQANEEEVRQQLQNALLQGEDILETEFYNVLKKENYFISVIQWRFLDKNTGKKVIFEAGLRNSKLFEDFYTDVFAIIDQGLSNLSHRKPYKTEKDKYTNAIVDKAFEMHSSLTTDECTNP